ncbi:DEAD-box ATP-dependent RNA helicase 46-like isoform X2 [Hibiscus syriacus]|uniref:DEAD-box ATP-dependent RNA helicase 46-like isoform X2 n=1 Tax=Hibiscus syriacus TaxID=106335 RepID=A0A6A3AN73_HIBSY|nr:DEAD-box ATP-dependent RNA helicase 46-like isoform X2 [Hibiscus syriacus]
MQHVDSDNNSSDYEAIFQDDFTDIDSSSDTEEILNSDSDEENKLLHLTKMGFSEAEALITMERCGSDSLIAELIDFICADQMAKATDALLMMKLEKKLLNEDDHAVHLSIPMIGSGVPTEPDQITQRTLPEDAIGSPYFYYEQIHLSNLMIGFGVHTKSDQITQRTLTEDAIGSPYFYYENVSLVPVNVWTGMSQYLFDVEPEFVDSKHFCAAAQKRGYIHNLPIENKFPLILLTPRTTHDIFPLTNKWIRKVLEACDDEPSSSVHKYVLDEYRKWNLVWVGRNKVAPLEPDEVEMLLGFLKNHTRGGGC